MKKRLILGLLAFMTMGGTTAVYADDASYLPLRTTMENIGYKVEWNGADKSIKVTGEKGSFTFKPDNNMVYDGNGRGYKLYSPVKLENGTAYVGTDTLEKLGISVENNKDFGYRLNSQFNQNENYVFSPYSLKAALAMVANGAKGDTQQEILKALDYSSINELNAHMKNLTKVYNQDDVLKLSSANSLWTNNALPPISSEFTESIKENFNGESRAVSVAEASSEIQKWVAEKSNGMQKDFKMSVDDSFALALVNTTYLKAEWVNEFDSNNTYKEEFTGSDGKKTNIEFMHDTATYTAYKDDKVSLVKLNYKDKGDGRALAFYAVIAPENTDFEEYMEKAELQKVKLSLPKFKGKTNITLNDTLKNMGINLVFTTEADLSGISGEKGDLLVTSVVQDTVIDVDEKGTEASSTTAVMVGATSYNPTEPVEISFNEPFTYFIKDEANDEILFMGRFAKGE
mgnify:CR=1 FL=1